jgi:hypothetical protein
MSLRRAFLAGLGTLDDATAYLIAARITDAAISTDVRWFVQSLKDAGLWSKIKALWPILGGTAASHAVNLKQPARFMLSYSGTAYLAHTGNGMASTHSHNGNAQQADGTDVFADTGFNLAVDMAVTNGYAMHYYTNNIATANSPSDSVDMGVYGSPSEALLLSASNASNGNNPVVRAGGVLLRGTSTASTGLYTAQQSPAGLVQLVRNGVVESSAVGTATTPLNDTVYLMAMDVSQSTGYGYGFSARPCQTAAITENLSASDMQAFNSLTQQLQTKRGRAA